MMLLVKLSQPLGRNVRINLGRRQIAVPQQHLHHAQVCAVVEQMGGKRVS